MRSLTASLLATVLVTGATVHAAVKPYIETTPDFNTECKTCPRSLCPNKIAYQSDDKFNVTCWTHGTKIMGDNLWLKSEAGCYVTQYDVQEYPGDYTTDLKYCGRDSEVQKLTIEDARLKYKTECRICPRINCDTISYLNENTDVELTCWYPDGQLIIDDPYWLKTTNNCYVARKNLYSKPNLARLDNCGPVPLLEIANHNNENGTSDVNKREASPEPEPEPKPVPVPVPVPESQGDFNVMYLINVTVGEEYAYCHTCANVTCPTKRTYEFDQEVWLQCYEHDNNAESWSLTTDFCYVNNKDFWQSPGGDNYRFPSCTLFNNGGKPGNGDDDGDD